MAETAEAPAVGLDQIVERYVQLRDKKAELKSEYELKTDKINQALERIEAFLLKEFQAKGLESVRTKFGTAYQQERVSATVADWDQTLPWIIEGEHWSMLEKRVSKPFVEAYKQEHNDLPPGINWRSEMVVNVRRT